MPLRTTRPVLILPALLLALAAGRVSAADAVLDWNGVLLETVRETRTNPPRATRAFAMTHLAVYDAVNGLKPRFEHYLVDPALSSPPNGASAEAAAATAAHAVLRSLYPARAALFDAQLTRSLNAVSSKEQRRKGAEWGARCAAAILALRANDGSDVVVPYAPTPEPGRWQPTPPGFAPALLPGWGQVAPFAMLASSQFRPAPPPDLASFDYATALVEVQELGDADSDLRTADETEIAFFWEDGAGTVTPPGHWQLIAQELSRRNRLSLAENARLFALLSMTQADAAIVSWDCKFAYDHWRPITGVRLADLDGNELTVADPDWTPLIPTPPFPAYTSGHSTFSGSSAELLERLFDDRSIELTLEPLQPTLWPEQLDRAVRHFDSLAEAAEEAGMSRIYGGIHWQYDNQAGLDSGRALAAFVFDTYLTPLKKRSRD